MRLIDGDALKECIGCADAVKHGNKTEEQLHNSYSTLMMYEIADYIDDMRTVDAEPVRHASLKETGFDEAWCNWGDCTNCGTSNIFGSKYCNECGAKLDGGKE